MKKQQLFYFDVRDFLVDVMDLTYEEIGIYITLQGKLGLLPREETELPKLLSCDKETFDKCWPIMRDKFKIVNGKVSPKKPLYGKAFH